VRRRRGAARRSQSVDPSPIRPHQFSFEGATRQDLPAARPGDGGQFLQQPRLTDPGISHQQHDLAAATVGGGAQLLSEPRDFDVAADERGRSDDSAGNHDVCAVGDGRRGRRASDSRISCVRALAQRHANFFHFARRLSPELARQQLPAALVLVERLARAADLAQQAHHREVRGFRQRIQRQQRACVAQSLLG